MEKANEVEIFMGAGVKVKVFLHVMLYSPIGRYHHFKGTCCLLLQGKLVVAGSFEIFGTCLQTTQCHIQEHSDLRK
jgi:hypothetical protein